MIRKFTLASKTFYVYYVDGWIENDLVAQIDHDLGIIKVAKTKINQYKEKVAIPQEFIEQALLHEVVHAILSIMGENDLNNNERIVDLFAHFLHQYEKTKKEYD